MYISTSLPPLIALSPSGVIQPTFSTVLSGDRVTFGTVETYLCDDTVVHNSHPLVDTHLFSPAAAHPTHTPVTTHLPGAMASHSLVDTHSFGPAAAHPTHTPVIPHLPGAMASHSLMLTC